MKGRFKHSGEATGLVNRGRPSHLPTSSERIQDGFGDLVAEAREMCALRFGPKLSASYVAGSVARGEAWPGASDLDWFTFLTEAPTSADKSWRYRVQKKLQIRFPVAREVHLNVFHLRKLAQEPFWRFILKYNAVRMCGDDVLAQLDGEGVTTPKPGAAMAKGRLPFVRTCLAEAMAGRRIPALAELPADAALATRKLVRNFVVVEGAHYLMAVGSFKTFQADKVIQGLRRRAPQWAPIYDLADIALDDPYRVGVDPRRFMQMIQPFVEWMMSAIARA